MTIFGNKTGGNRGKHLVLLRFQDGLALAVSILRQLAMPAERIPITDARGACILVVDDEPLVAALMTPWG